MGKRVFNTYHASETETEGVKAALKESNIAYYETYKGKWGVGSAAVWVSDAEDYDKARAVINEFQQEWSAQVRQQYQEQEGGEQSTFARIRWARLPALLIVIGVVVYLTSFWYFL